MMKTVQEKLNFFNGLRRCISKNIETYLAKPIEAIVIWPSDKNIAEYQVQEIIESKTEPQMSLKIKNINDFDIIVFEKQINNIYNYHQITEKNEEYYKSVLNMYDDLNI